MTSSPASTQNYALRQTSEKSLFIVPLGGMEAQMRRIGHDITTWLHCLI
jgi:hypothetical protein